MTEHLDLDELEARAERAMHRRDTLPPGADAVDRWFALCDLADIVPDLLAEVRRLRAACGSPIPRDTGESLADVRLRTAFDGEGGQP